MQIPTYANLQTFHPSLPVLSASPNESQQPADAQTESQSGTMTFHLCDSSAPSVADDMFENEKNMSQPVDIACTRTAGIVSLLSYLIHPRTKTWIA